MRQGEICQSAAKEQHEKADNRCALERRCQQSMLGPSTTPSGVRQAKPHHVRHKPRLQLSGGFLLLTVSRLVGLRFYPLQREGNETKAKPTLHLPPLLCRAAWKQGTPRTSRCLTIDSAMTGASSSSPILNASAQLAKWAGAEGVPKMLLKHLQRQRSPKLSFNSGLTVLHRKLALGEPHVKRSKKVAECPGSMGCLDTEWDVLCSQGLLLADGDPKLL